MVVLPAFTGTGMRYFSVVATFLLLLSPDVLAADSQFSVNKCAALEAERMAIQAKMRRGYDVSEYNWLNGRELKLFNLQARHCVNPIPDEQAAAAYLAPDQQQRQRQQQAEITTNFPMMQANNAVFTGAKAKAWDVFYQMPVQCRVHQQQAEDFVFCAEDKLRQRQAFLQQWQQHAGAGTVLAGTTKSSLDKNTTPQSHQASSRSGFHSSTVADRQSYLSERILTVYNTSSQQLQSKQTDSQAEFKSPPNSSREPVMTQLQMNNSAQLQQLSGLGLGALLVFLWMSWWLWRR